MLLPDLLTLILIYLWHNNAQHCCHHYAIKVLFNRTLCSDQNSLNNVKSSFVEYLTWTLSRFYSSIIMGEVMKDNTMSFSINKDLDVHSENFDAFISYMKNSNDVWVIKDNESRFIYANDTMIYYSGLPKGFNIEGRLDGECPAPWSEFENIIQANDNNVMTSQKTIRVLHTFTYVGREKIIQPFLVNVTPLMKDGKCIGIVSHGKKLEIYSMYHFENNIHPESLTFGKPTDLFTDREFDIVFFALQSLSAKDIARKLGITYRTVQSRLQFIYQKIGINSLSQLKEYCRGKGYDNYAPTRFINPNPYITLA